MRGPKPVFKNRIFRMEGSYAQDDLVLKCAVIREGLSQITETTVEFLSNDRALKLQGVVGQDIQVILEMPDNSERSFAGICVSAEFLGLYQGFGHFTAEVRPWLWLLRRGSGNRIFQNLSVPRIIAEILGEYGFSADMKDKLTDSYQDREYCVQYGESDFDFISRLMEEEGIYYYFTTPEGGKRPEMILADSNGGHSAVKPDSDIEFKFREARFRRKDDHIFEWSAAEHVTTGKVTLADYNFETPQRGLTSFRTMKKGRHTQTGHEYYEYPGHFRKNDLGDKRARVRMEAEAAHYQRWMGVGNHRGLATGATFRLKNHPRVKDETEFLIADAVHYLQIETDYEDEDTITAVLGNRLDFGPDNTDSYRCVFGVIPKAEQFRAPLKTSWPAIAGLQTAVVVGPGGEEIHTDKYGRIKVQFHWDRDGQNDDKSTCWVRTVMPWTGKSWGFVGVPRIGQEVTIGFEEGDPDRPICTGMLYNAATMPPYGLPGNMTQSGIKTNSSKGGGGYHELMFEDKKGDELISFKSEKDYKQVVMNNAVITIGLEKQDKGDLTQTIHRHKTETLKTGNLTFTVEDGNEIRSVAKNQTEEIGDNCAQTIGKNHKQDIGDNSKITIGKNLTEEIGKNCEQKIGDNSKLEIGKNLSEKIGKGQTVEIGKNLKEEIASTQLTKIGKTLGLKIGSSLINKTGKKVVFEAGDSIELKVGKSSIRVSKMGITIKGPLITVKGDRVTQVKGGTALVLKGGMTMIN